MGSEAFQRSSRRSFGLEASLRDLVLDPIGGTVVEEEKVSA